MSHAYKNAILDGGGLKQNLCKQSLGMEESVQNNPQFLPELWHTAKTIRFGNDGGKAATGTSFLVSAPATCRPEARGTVVAFRRRRLRVQCPQGSNKGDFRFNNAAGASQTNKTISRYGKNRHTKEISVDDFPVNVAAGRKVLKWLTQADGGAEVEKCEVNQVDEEDCGSEGTKKEDGSSVDLSAVSNVGLASSPTKRLTNGKQLKSFMALDASVSHHVFPNSNFGKITKEKQRLTPTFLDSLERRLGSNVNFCRQKLEVTESLAWNPCKDLDIKKKARINNWLIDVAIERGRCTE